MRSAVIGLGMGLSHAIAYASRPEVEHVALCDLNQDLARRVAANLAKPASVHMTVDDLFAAGRIDVVSIVTPDHFHRPHAEAAFAAKAHVLVAKPIAPQLPDARAIVLGAREAGVKLMVSQEMRFRPRYRRARELIEAGRLGEIAYIGMTEFYQYVRQKFARAPWYAQKESGRTMITGSGVHQVDLVRWLAGKALFTVTALGNRIGEIPFHHNKTIVALFRFEGETIGQVTFSYEGVPDMPRGGLVVIGSRGMIGDNRYRTRDGDEESLDVSDPSDAYPRSFGGNLLDGTAVGNQACVHAFLDALRDGTPVPVPGEEGFASVAASVAADRSCETSAPVEPERLED